MSVNDPVVVEYREKLGKFILLRGNETFYDFERYLITFDTVQDAVEFSINEIGEPPIVGEAPKGKRNPDPGEQLAFDI